MQSATAFIYLQINEYLRKRYFFLHVTLGLKMRYTCISLQIHVLRLLQQHNPTTAFYLRKKSVII